MPLLNFQRRFAEAVASGAKTMTIRRPRKRPILPGMRLYLYTGLRSRLTCKLGEGRCIEVSQLHIGPDGAVELEGKRLADAALEGLALHDGFASTAEFVGFFRRVHGLPFSGCLIRWELQER